MKNIKQYYKSNHSLQDSNGIIYGKLNEGKPLFGLNKQINSKKNNDFDIALVSCGSYGMSLCSAIIDMRKNKIYVGDVLQFMFGIAGLRYDTQDEYLYYINKRFSSKPYKKDYPKSYLEVENGCY